ncbi:glycosyltransferase family 2 protein [Clostridium polynesiense]|uniref:glycosyltransferase family 2 protein n=1 Tax=Clostridium polynesiense TaxID=1325933 RepID=UPI00058EAC84|nr:glycosyltransferase [Clostridium polynesiense]
MASRFKNEVIKDMVSVILLSYNSGEYLFEAIESVIKQDYPLIELIISDDGSKDFDEEKIRLYIDNNANGNVTYSIIHREKNIGTVKNINNALAISRGEYIRILGGDDTYPVPDAFSKMIELLKKDNSIAVVGKLEQCDHMMNSLYDPRVEKSNNALEKVLHMDYISGRRYIAKKDIFPIANQAVCYRRDFFADGGFCDEKYVLIEDIALANRLLAANKKLSFFNDYSVKHRAKVGISTSRELFAPRRLLYYQDCITYAQLDIAKHPEIYGKIYCTEQVRLSKFVYDMAKAKEDGKSVIKQAGIMLTYVDTIFYYVLTNTRKFLRRMKERFQ